MAYDVSSVLCKELSDIFSLTAEINIILPFMFVNLKDKTSAVKTQHTCVFSHSK